MRWEDERYVKAYTRDTPDFLALGWEARALFWELLRKADRAGLFEVGKSGNRGIAAVTGVPIEVVDRALPTLLSDGCVEDHGNKLLIRNYIEAQNAKQSDKARQMKSRESARDGVRGQLALLSQDVTIQPGPITECDSKSKSVTPIPSHPILSQPPIVPQGGHRKRIEYSDAFQKAWKLYVRGEDKAGAWNAWKRLSKEFDGGEVALCESIRLALEWQVPRWKIEDGAFPKHQQWFVRYLTHRRWEDERPTHPPIQHSQQKKYPQQNFDHSMDVVSR